jgi:hypothetical protein
MLSLGCGVQVDLVTETDKACEDLIVNHLKQLYPTHKVRLDLPQMIKSCFRWVAIMATCRYLFTEVRLYFVVLLVYWGRNHSCFWHYRTYRWSHMDCWSPRWNYQLCAWVIINSDILVDGDWWNILIFTYWLAIILLSIFCRFPFVCVSIGLTIGKVPTVGVVYNPIMNEVRNLFSWICFISAF